MAVAETVHAPSDDFMKSMKTVARISLAHAFLSISFSKAMFMFRKSRAPVKSDGVLLHLMEFPLQTSPLNPATLESLHTNEKPSPLLRTMSFLMSLTSIELLSLFSPVTCPISSPMDFAASIAAHFPRFPSMKSSV